ncbi:MerR family transcriptional regulator [Streptomyces sp. MNU76]|uniref:MerR family transcriptional regulator n=1 Tax=Streptomyces sp. MNU76 TaxID=2560026 RepID=UPI001E52E5E4|nr:MerR family transcriptional regulator [Streptomyces sp. MNU76]MCC9711300.1 MerR family transcriptional regulator [Streptomyces sp. MNU76]
MAQRPTPGFLAPAPEQVAELPRHRVTTGFLARRLGVSPTTLRSWDRRYGLGPAVRAEGRQRRWSPEDVAMLQEMCRLTATGVPPAEAARAAMERARGQVGEVPRSTVVPPAARPGDVGVPAPAAPAVRARRGHPPASALPLGDVRQECRGLARAAVRLDAAAVQEQLLAVVGAYGLVVAWEEVMAPTLRAVGRKWESSGDRYVEVEHLLSWYISTTLRHMYLSTPGPAGEAAPVLLACLPDEHHTLPLEALAAALAERRVPVLMLGGAVPAEAMDAAVRRVAPAAVALWAQSRATAGLALAQHIAATRWGIRGARRQSPVLLCGPGWGRRTPEELPRPSGLQDAVTMLVPLSASTRP